MFFFAESGKTLILRGTVEDVQVSVQVGFQDEWLSSH